MLKIESSNTKDIPRMVPQVVSNVEPSEEGLGDVEARQKRQDPPGVIGGLGPGGLDSWDLLMKGILT